jgi:RsiW-degrading membrane proteinase PrsW (M82 family)
MEPLLLALGGLAPCGILLLIGITLLRQLKPPVSYCEIGSYFAFGLLSLVLAVAIALLFDVFTTQFLGHPNLFGLYDAFLVAAFPEEFSRYCILRWRLGKERNQLNSQRCLLFGAIVGIGFASIENTGYCVTHGWSAVWGRAITSVPLHACSGAIIGYAVGLSLRTRQLRWSLLGVVTTVILHGVNNFNFKLLYAGHSPDDDVELPTEGFGAFMITGWPSNIAVVLLLLGIVSWLALRIRRESQDVSS